MTVATTLRPGNQIDKAMTRSVFRQFSSKWEVADWIISQFPPHITYFEPFGGTFSVGLRKRPVLHQIYNDLHFDVFNFFKQLQDRPHELMAAIAASPKTEEEFERCQKPTPDRLESARRYYLSCQGSSGVHPSRFAADRDDSHLWAIADRIRRMTIWNMNAFEIIPIFDNPETLFYIDPPYPHQARGSQDSCHQNQDQAKPRWPHQHEMTEDEHQALAALLKSLRGKVYISGYDCPLYNELYQGWERLEKEVKTGENTTIECLWMKPANLPIARQSQTQAKKPAPKPAKPKRPTPVNPPSKTQAEVKPPRVVPPPLPPRPTTFESLQEELDYLKQERDRLKQWGVAPDNCWIETSTVQGRPAEWKQAFWRSTEAIFEGKKGGMVKRRYIGRVGSEAHEDAIAAIARRKELGKISDRIKVLEMRLKHS